MARALVLLLVPLSAFAGGTKSAAPRTGPGAALIAAPAALAAPFVPPTVPAALSLSPSWSAATPAGAARTEPSHTNELSTLLPAPGVRWINRTPLSAEREASAAASLGKGLEASHPAEASGLAPRGPAAELASASGALVRGLSDPAASPSSLSEASRAGFEGSIRKDGGVPLVRAAAPSSSKPSRLSRYTGKLGRAATGASLAFGGAAIPLGQVAAADGGAASPVAWAAGALGLALGMRHALDPDHVIALLNLVAGQKSKWTGWKLGALWGLGHSVALLAVGGGLVLAKGAMPETWAAGLETIVALMLVGLGAAAIVRERRTARHGHYHDLADLKLRPFVIGLIHGLAGSGAVALLALAAVPGAAAGFLYLGMFGLGTIVGMSVVTFFVQALAARLVSDPKVRGRVAIAAGLASAAFGAYMLLELLPILMGSWT